MMENQPAQTEAGVDLEAPFLDYFLDRPIRNDEDCFEVICATLSKLAVYIDHVDHHEVADATIINTVGQQLLNVVAILAEAKGIDLPTAYGERLAKIEEANSLKSDIIRPTGADIIAAASTWREMQTGQILHDEQYHSSVINNPESWKLNHYSNHIAKLPIKFLRDVVHGDQEDLAGKHLADLAAFGIKLTTEFSKQRLPETPIRHT